MTQQSPQQEQAVEPATEPSAQTPPAETLEETPLDPSRLVPVAESIRYRRRAQQAERHATELQRQLDEQRQANTAAKAELEAIRRRGDLTRLLAGRRVVDLDAAILLAEQRLTGPDADLPATIEQLLKDKPYLAARESVAPPSGGVSERLTASLPALPPPTQGRRTNDGPAEALRAAARQAAAAGRGQAMDRYLRLRRRFR